MPTPWNRAEQPTDDEGASSVEYGLLIAGIAALIVAVVFVFGGFVADLFTGTCNEIDSHASVTMSCE